MSTITGCYWRDGRPARAGDLSPSGEAGIHDAAGGFGIRVSGPAALASVDDGRASEPDSLLEDCALIAFDGRIDNGADMRSLLSLPAAAPDARLALESFRAHGVEAAARLIGDYAFAVWEPDSRRLVCIRDPMGQRPLFYAVTPRCVVFGSAPRQVLSHSAVDRAINDGMVAEYLSGVPATIDETLWRHVRRLPPGHALVASRQEVGVVRCWDFDPGASLSCRTDAEYSEQFRDLFARAVRSRLGDRPAAVFLSGGIDSTAVAGVASRLARQGATGRVHALSVTFPGRDCDETPYIDEVVRFCGMPAERLAAQPPAVAELHRSVDRSFDVPAYPNGLVMDPLRRRAAELGAATVLTGYGGDEWFTGRRPPTPLTRVRGLVRPIVPPFVRRALRSMTHPGPPACDWIRAEFASRVDLPDRLRPPPAPSFPTDSQRAIYQVARGAIQVMADEAEDRAARLAGIEQRHPFYDRRLAEFGLALPDAQRFDSGNTKAVVRRALRELMPQVVTDRQGKAEFSATFVEALEQIGGIEIFRWLRCEEAGWVDGGAIRRRYDRMIGLYRRGRRSYIPWTNGLWEVVGLEVWLNRAVEGARL